MNRRSYFWASLCILLLLLALFAGTLFVYPVPKPTGSAHQQAIATLALGTRTPTFSLLPSAATSDPSKPPTLIVWSRWSVNRPPPPEPKVNCLWHGANLLVWDNGRVLILQSHPDGGYDILSGQLDQERMRQLIEPIKTHGALGTATPPRPNPAGNYSDVGARLDGDNYALNGDTLRLLTTWLAQDATPYVPQRAWLTVEPYPVVTSTYYKYQKPEELPVWPGDRLGFALSQVPTSGREIEGQAAAFVWREATSGRSIFTGFREGTDTFAVFISFQQSDPLMDSMFVPCRQNR